MTLYRCGSCGRTSVNPGTPGLDSRYRFGPCPKHLGGCGRKRAEHRLVDEQQEQRVEARAKEVGMRAAELASTPSGWVERFDAELERRAATGVPFTSEDVTYAVGQPPSSGAVGARINAAARRGLIVHVGYTKARRPNQHAAELRQWKGRT